MGARFVIKCPPVKDTYDKATTEEIISWKKDGRPLLGSRNALVEIARMETANFGRYKCTRLFKDKQSGREIARHVGEVIVPVPSREGELIDFSCTFQ